MPTTSKVGSKIKRRRETESEDTTAVVFPSEPTEPITLLGEASTLIFGEKKIGKTSLASQFPGSFFFMFEPGNKGLRIFVERFDPTEWPKFKKWVKAFWKQKQFKTAIVDVSEKAYTACMKYVCKKNGWDHPNDAGYGSGWFAVNDEFQSTMDLLINAPGKGVVFLSHATERDFQSRDGDDYTKIVPNMPKGASDYVCGTVDLILYYGYVGTERTLAVSGSQYLESNQRISSRFWTADGKKRIKTIPAGDDEIEAFENLTAAWNNEQTTSGIIKGKTLQLSNAPAKRKDSGAKKRR